MPRGAVIRALAIAATLIVAAAIAVAGRNRSADISPLSEGERPALMLVTSLPLVFAEEFTLDGGRTKALAALESRYRVIPIGTTDSSSLGRARLLLLAHPLAQPAEDLVALDRWVRLGGRVLLLADPMLEWPSTRPLGDRLRPPPGFADTGLLAHWGLTLEAPEDRGSTLRALGGRRILAVSPGSLSGSCRISADRFVAYCRIGRGHATVVADADFLNVERLEGTSEKRNLDGMLGELAALER